MDKKHILSIFLDDFISICKWKDLNLVGQFHNYWTSVK